MSRTTRRMQGYKYRDGKQPGEIYHCTCNYCMGVEKRKLMSKIATRELKKELQECDINTF